MLLYYSKGVNENVLTFSYKPVNYPELFCYPQNQMPIAYNITISFAYIAVGRN